VTQAPHHADGPRGLDVGRVTVVLLVVYAIAYLAWTSSGWGSEAVRIAIADPSAVLMGLVHLSGQVGFLLLGAVTLTGIVIGRQVLALHDRSRAETALRKNQETLQAVFAAAPVAIAATDLDENVTLWSHAAERVFGWKADEVVGAPWPAVPPDRRGESDAIRDRWQNGEAFGLVEMVHLRQDGSPIELEASFAPLLGAEGEPVGSVSTMRDVTEERR
jgi:PAS domain S-box-containing protein